MGFRDDFGFTDSPRTLKTKKKKQKTRTRVQGVAEQHNAAIIYAAGFNFFKSFRPTIYFGAFLYLAGVRQADHLQLL